MPPRKYNYDQLLKPEEKEHLRKLDTMIKLLDDQRQIYANERFLLCQRASARGRQEAFLRRRAERKAS